MSCGGALTAKTLVQMAQLRARHLSSKKRRLHLANGEIHLEFVWLLYNHRRTDKTGVTISHW